MVDHSRTLAHENGDAAAAVSTAAYQPESPFLNEAAYDGAPALGVGSESGTAPDEIESPFLTQFSLESGTPLHPEAMTYSDIVEDLFDEEFEEQIDDVVADLRGVYEGRLLGSSAVHAADAAAHVESYFEPLVRAAEEMFDRMAEGIGDLDLESLPEPEIDVVLDRFAPVEALAHPVFDDFLGGLLKKAKKAVKRVAKKAKRAAGKVAKVAGMFSPTRMILAKLRKLVRPMLKRVLRVAINKIPRRLRPLARKLAKRFLGVSAEAPAEGLTSLDESDDSFDDDPAAAAVNAGFVQRELDGMVASYVIEGEAFEEDLVAVEYFRDDDPGNDDPAGDLERAREKFAREIVRLPAGADPEPLVREFVPAVLPALRLGIRVIGRKRVVDFLAALVARLIRRFVGRQNAPALSRALVDAGLKLVDLEAPERDEDRDAAAGDLLAATVEETIANLVADAPEDGIDDEALLGAHLHEAFERAVAANFPPQLLRPQLRAAPRAMGAWVLRPSTHPKRYKKFTRVFDVALSPRAAQRIRSFGGRTLGGFLGEQLGLPVERDEISGRLHLYEATRGTSLPVVALHESATPGLGSADRAAWSQLHPLTEEAASLLLPRDVGLYREVPDRFLADPRRIAAGQRFYFLEIPGGRVLLRRAGGAGHRARGVPLRTSEVNVTIDFRRRQIAVLNYLAEARAQAIASRLRRGDPIGAVVSALRATMRAGLMSALSGRPQRRVRIVRELAAQEELAPAIAGILRWGGDDIGRALLRFVVQQLTRSLRDDAGAFSRDFATAAEDEADGVTVVFRAEVDIVFDLLNASLFEVPRLLARLAKRGLQGSLRVEVRPGFVRS